MIEGIVDRLGEALPVIEDSEGTSGKGEVVGVGGEGASVRLLFCIL